MEVKLKLLTPQKQINDYIRKELAKRMNQCIPSIISEVKSQLSFYIANKIKSTPEYQSLLNGKLEADLGLDNVNARLDAIIEQWANNFYVILKPFTYNSRGFSGSFSVCYIERDFSDVLVLSEATVFSLTGNVPWLEWLLLEGSRILVRDYEVVYNLSGKQAAVSRSGDALMREAAGSKFTVDPQFQGTITNNWITRAFENSEQDISDILTVALINTVT